MPGDDVDVAVADGDERLVPVALADAGGAEQAAMGGAGVAPLDRVGTHAVNLDSGGTPCSSLIVADPTSASKVGDGPGPASPRPPPDEVADQEAGEEGHGKRQQDQQRPGQDGGGLEDHLADGRIWRSGGKIVGGSIVIAGRTAPRGGSTGGSTERGSRRNDRRKFGRSRRLRSTPDPTSTGSPEAVQTRAPSGRSRGSDALAGRDDQVHEFGLDPDVLGTERRQVIGYRRRDLFHERRQGVPAGLRRGCAGTDRHGDCVVKPWPGRDASAVTVCSSGRGTFSSAAHLGQEMTVPAFLDETPRS